MEIHFDKEYLQQLYEEGKTKDKKYRFQPQMVKRYQSVSYTHLTLPTNREV